MSSEHIYAVVDSYVGERAPRRLAPDESLIDSGAFDSIGVLELVAFIEQRFGIQLEDEDISPHNFRSIRSVAELVSDLVQR